MQLVQLKNNHIWRIPKMKSKTNIWLFMGVNLLILTLVVSLSNPSIAVAQEEQWLQYRQEREAEQIIGDIRRRSLQLKPERPQGVELPAFKCDQPFFTSWSTPMVKIGQVWPIDKSGKLWIALDRSSEKGKLDLLYIDSNANGHLNDETAITAYRTEEYYAYFGPVKVVFEGEDGPLTYHLNFMSYENGQTRMLLISSGCWYEGEITVAGQKKYACLSTTTEMVPSMINPLTTASVTGYELAERILRILFMWAI